MTHGEKNETRPAMSATGMASTSDPEDACCWNHSATLRHLTDHLDQGPGRGHGAVDRGGRTALGIEHDSGRHGVRRDHAGEGEQRLAAGRVERGPGDAVAGL